MPRAKKILLFYLGLIFCPLQAVQYYSSDVYTRHAKTFIEEHFPPHREDLKKIVGEILFSRIDSIKYFLSDNRYLPRYLSSGKILIHFTLPSPHGRELHDILNTYLKWIRGRIQDTFQEECETLKNKNNEVELKKIGGDRESCSFQEIICYLKETGEWHNSTLLWQQVYEEKAYHEAMYKLLLPSSWKVIFIYFD